MSQMKKVSVIFCTARHGGLDILVESMKGQTYGMENIEVIVVDELRRNHHLSCPDKYTIVEPPPKKDGMFWNLSASLNAGVRAASGELIVLLQDYIWVPPAGIQKFVERSLQEPRSIITGVGHQYSLPSHVDYPSGLFSCWSTFPGPPSGELTFSDPRSSRPGFYLCIPVEWEANWGAFPRQAWIDIGGFDEEFDAGWGYDNVNFSERCQMAGYHIFIDTYNEVLCYSHINLFGEQKRRDEAPNNQKLWYRKYRDIERKQGPWKLNYV